MATKMPPPPLEAIGARGSVGDLTNVAWVTNEKEELTSDLTNTKSW